MLQQFQGQDWVHCQWHVSQLSYKSPCKTINIQKTSRPKAVNFRIWFKFYLIGSFSNLGMLRISRLYFNTRGKPFALEFSCRMECPVYINRINIICTEEVQMEDEPFRISLYLLYSLCCFGAQRPLCCKWHFHGLDTVGVLSSKTLRPQRVWVWPIFRCLKQICKCCKSFLNCFCKGQCLNLRAWWQGMTSPLLRFSHGGDIQRWTCCC